MSQVESRTPQAEVTDKDEAAILNILKRIDLKQLLVDDYLDIPVEVIPGYLEVTYRTTFGGEVMEVDEELDGLEVQSESARYHYSIFRSLASSVRKLNGEKLKGSTPAERIETLKNKNQQVLEKLLWGHLAVREAVRRWIEDPAKVEESIKKSSGTPSAALDANDS